MCFVTTRIYYIILYYIILYYIIPHVLVYLRRLAAGFSPLEVQLETGVVAQGLGFSEYFETCPLIIAGGIFFFQNVEQFPCM